MTGFVPKLEGRTGKQHMGWRVVIRITTGKCGQSEQPGWKSFAGKEQRYHVPSGGLKQNEQAVQPLWRDSNQLVGGCTASSELTSHQYHRAWAPPDGTFPALEHHIRTPDEKNHESRNCYRGYVSSCPTCAAPEQGHGVRRAHRAHSSCVPSTLLGHAGKKPGMSMRHWCYI